MSIARFLAKAWAFAIQDIQDRFAGSLLGSLWTLIWPLAQVCVYMLVFGKLMAGRLGVANASAGAYGFYMASGLIIWTCFANSLNRASRAIVDKRSIITKVRVSLAIFPVAACLGELIPLFASVAVVIVADLIRGWRPDPIWMSLVFFAIYSQAILALGLGCLFGSLAAFARDFAEIVGIAVQVAFWLTPVVYPLGILPAWVAKFIWLNPMTAIVGVFQQCFALGGTPRWPEIIYAAIVAHACLFGGFAAFRHWSKDIRDVL